MNNKEKLADLERRQRDIADEIKQLREEPAEHVPEVGDVYEPFDEECPHEFSTHDGWVYLGREGYSSGPKSHQKFLGKFSDVFITKQRVAEIVSRCDGDGDNIFSNVFGVGSVTLDRIARDLKAEGITEIK